MNQSVEPAKTKPENDQEVRTWLEAQLDDWHPFLLAFADDGVIWGRLVDGQLKTPYDLYKEAHPEDMHPDGVYPELRGKTIQQAFVFGPEEEIRLFHDALGEWKAVSIKDGETFIQESQILWGDEVSKKPEGGFSLIRDHTKGISNQLVPLEIEELESEDCLRLEVHHQIYFDPETGEARIALSRLANLRVGLRSEVSK